MAAIPASRPNLFASAAGIAALLALGGCASVTEPVAETATVKPIAEPGTETAAYTLPDKSEEDAGANGTTAGEDTATAAATEAQDNKAMEPGLDTGEPEGLEAFVAANRIVPMTRPAYEPTAFAASRTTAAFPVAEQPVGKSGTPIDALITRYAALYEIPEALLHRVVRRESNYNPRAYNRGHYGLMQIKPATARTMGYEGPAEGLFDAETNIKYAAKYLRGAWLVADDKNDGAVRLYAAGYYYHAKRKGLLEETGLK